MLSITYNLRRLLLLLIRNRTTIWMWPPTLKTSLLRRPTYSYILNAVLGFHAVDNPKWHKPRATALY